MRPAIGTIVHRIAFTISARSPSRAKRGAEILEERGMIIKDVFIRKHPVCPCPDDMQMLRFVRVPRLVVYVKPPKPEQDQKKSNADPELDSRKLSV
jgi:hypothetical protein